MVRQSKFRHVFGKGYKTDMCFNGLTTEGQGDTNCAVSCVFFAMIKGQKIFVVPLDKPGRLEVNNMCYIDYKSKVLDIQFSPFNDYLLASGHENGDINVWNIPEGGLTKTISEPFWEFHEVHNKKVTSVQWHPAAEHVLATAGHDEFITVWDCENQSNKYTIEVGKLNNIAWNKDGSRLAISTKGTSSASSPSKLDQVALLIVDPRNPEVVLAKTTLFEGYSKTLKTVFLSNGNIVTVGQQKSTSRHILMWDKDLQEQIAEKDVGSAVGMLNVMYDDELNILYTFAKGETVLNFYEFDEVDIHYLASYSSTTNQRGGNFLPKRAVEYNSNEIARFYKLQDKKCEPVVLECPRKSDHFQADIFPACRSGEKGLTAEEWFEGKNCDPPVKDIRELDYSVAQNSGAPKRTQSCKPLVKKTLAKREEDHQSANGAFDDVDVIELLEDVKKLKSTVKKLSKRVTELESRAAGECENGGEEEEEEEE